MIASLVIRAPTREELDEMEIAAGAVLDGVAVLLAKANPGLVELVAVLTLIGAMNGVDPAVLTKLTEEDLATVSQALETTPAPRIPQNALNWTDDPRDEGR